MGHFQQTEAGREFNLLGFCLTRLTLSQALKPAAVLQLIKLRLVGSRRRGCDVSTWAEGVRWHLGRLATPPFAISDPIFSLQKKHPYTNKTGTTR